MSIPDYVVKVSGETSQGKSWHGTGSLISQDGLVLTCWHVVKDVLEEQQINVQRPHGSRWKYTLNRDLSSPTDDLAILEGVVPANPAVPYLRVTDSDSIPPQIGESVTACGYSSPYFEAAQLFQMRVSGFSQETGMIGLNGDLNPGDSGGPVLNSDHHLIGINYAVDPERHGHSFAIPAHRVVTLLTRHGLLYDVTPDADISGTDNADDGIIGFLRKHQQPLTGDPTGRINRFLQTYLGDGDSPVPFGGRDIELAMLDDWIDDRECPPYTLLLAPAGRGKSALLVRWWSRLLSSKSPWSVLFCPINKLHGTNTDRFIFTTLANQLARLLGEPAPVAQPDPEIWRGIVISYLGRLSQSNVPTVIILDGLDEAENDRLASQLFPCSPGNSLRVIVSARQAPDDDCKGSAWRRQLGWTDSHYVQTIRLEYLQEVQVAEVLERMGFGFGALNATDEIVKSLHQLTKGDPLIVGLYARALWSDKERLPNLTTKQLKSLNPGLAGFFEYWWDDLNATWGADAVTNKLFLQTLLNILSTALGPLPRSDIVALTSECEWNTWDWTQTLNTLSRFVIGSAEYGYSYGHPEFGRFVYERLSTDEQIAMERRFLSLGLSTLQSVRDETDTANLSGYAVRYYGQHLERLFHHSDAVTDHNSLADAIQDLTSEDWKRAWELAEGGFGGFAADVRRAWDTAREVNRIAVDSGDLPPALGLEFRCALIQSSVLDATRKMSPEVMIHAIHRKVVSVSQVIATAMAIAPDHRAALFLGIADVAVDREKSEIVALLLDTLQELTVDQRIKICVTNSHLLPRDCILDAVAFAERLDHEWRQGSLLEALVRSCDNSMLPRCFTVIRNLSDDRLRCLLLSTIADRLPTRFHPAVLELLSQVQERRLRQLVLMPLVHSLSPEYHKWALCLAAEFNISQSEEEWIVNVIKEAYDQAPILSLEDADEVLCQMNSDIYHAQTLASITGTLSRQQLSDAGGLARRLFHQRQFRLATDLCVQLLSSPEECFRHRAIILLRVLDDDVQLEWILSKKAYSLTVQETVLLIYRIQTVDDPCRRIRLLTRALNMSEDILTPRLTHKACNDELGNPVFTVEVRDRDAYLAAAARHLDPMSCTAALEFAQMITDSWSIVDTLVNLYHAIHTDERDEYVANITENYSPLIALPIICKLAPKVDLKCARVMLRYTVTQAQAFSAPNALAALLQSHSRLAEECQSGAQFMSHAARVKMVKLAWPQVGIDIEVRHLKLLSLLDNENPKTKLLCRTILPQSSRAGSEYFRQIASIKHIANLVPILRHVVRSINKQNISVSTEEHDLLHNLLSHAEPSKDNRAEIEQLLSTKTVVNEKWIAVLQKLSLICILRDSACDLFQKMLEDPNGYYLTTGIGLLNPWIEEGEVDTAIEYLEDNPTMPSWFMLFEALAKMTLAKRQRERMLQMAILRQSQARTKPLLTIMRFFPPVETRRALLAMIDPARQLVRESEVCEFLKASVPLFNDRSVVMLAHTFSVLIDNVGLRAQALLCILCHEKVGAHPDLLDQFTEAVCRISSELARATILEDALQQGGVLFSAIAFEALANLRDTGYARLRLIRGLAGNVRGSDVKRLRAEAEMLTHPLFRFQAVAAIVSALEEEDQVTRHEELIGLLSAIGDPENYIRAWISCRELRVRVHGIRDLVSMLDRVFAGRRESNVLSIVCDRLSNHELLVLLDLAERNEIGRSYPFIVQELAHRVCDGLGERILAVAKKTGDDGLRLLVLVHCLEHREDIDTVAVFDEVIPLLHELRDPHEAANLLILLAEQRSSLVGLDILAITESCCGIHGSSVVDRTIWNLSEADLIEALKIVSQMEVRILRDVGLAALSVRLPVEVVRQVLEESQRIGDQAARNAVLLDVIDGVSTDTLDAALDVIEMISDDATRLECIVRVFHRFQGDNTTRGLTLLLAKGSVELRMRALVSTVDAVPVQLLGRVLNLIEEAIHCCDVAKLFERVLIRLPSEEYDRAFSLLQRCSEKTQVSTICCAANSLESSGIPEVFIILKSLRSPALRSELLRVSLPLFPESIQISALEFVSKLSDDHKVHALQDSIPRLQESCLKRVCKITKALERDELKIVLLKPLVATKYTNVYSRAIRMIRRLPEASRVEILASCGEQAHQKRFKALIKEAKRLSNHLHICHVVSSVLKRARGKTLNLALLALDVGRLDGLGLKTLESAVAEWSEEQVLQAIRFACDNRNEACGGAVLAVLSGYIPASEFAHVLEYAVHLPVEKTGDLVVKEIFTRCTPAEWSTVVMALMKIAPSARGRLFAQAVQLAPIETQTWLLQNPIELPDCNRKEMISRLRLLVERHRHNFARRTQVDNHDRDSKMTDSTIRVRAEPIDVIRAIRELESISDSSQRLVEAISILMNLEEHSLSDQLTASQFVLNSMARMERSKCSPHLLAIIRGLSQLDQRQSVVDCARAVVECGSMWP